MQPIDLAKKRAALEALSFVKEGMTIGLGTGSTARFFLEELAKKKEQGFQVQGVASSKETAELALNLGIKLLDLSEIESLSYTIDGADFVDHELSLIKGGGGALLREKTCALFAKEMICIVDETKLATPLPLSKVPIEVVPFSLPWVEKELKRLGYLSTKRKTAHGELFITDNQNIIIDVDCKGAENLKSLEQTLLSIHGVIETGLFLKIAKRLIIGRLNGDVEVKERKA